MLRADNVDTGIIDDILASNAPDEDGTISYLDGTRKAGASRSAHRRASRESPVDFTMSGGNGLFEQREELDVGPVGELGVPRVPRPLSKRNNPLITEEDEAAAAAMIDSQLSPRRSARHQDKGKRPAVESPSPLPTDTATLIKRKRKARTPTPTPSQESGAFEGVRDIQELSDGEDEEDVEDEALRAEVERKVKRLRHDRASKGEPAEPSVRAKAAKKAQVTRATKDSKRSAAAKKGAATRAANKAAKAAKKK